VGSTGCLRRPIRWLGDVDVDVDVDVDGDVVVDVFCCDFCGRRKLDESTLFGGGAIGIWLYVATASCSSLPKRKQKCKNKRMVQGEKHSTHPTHPTHPKNNMSALAKRQRTTKSRPTSTLIIGTHSGTFQADEAMGVFLLRCLPLYHKSPVLRTRNTEELAPLPIVIDVGGVFDQKLLRFDHHQRTFNETFGDKFQIKLSACGLVFKFYGREIITSLFPQLESEPDKVTYVYEKLYKGFIEGLDAIDNGIEVR